MAVTNNFVESSLNLNGQTNFQAPTALVWGPDGKLYVTERFGEVKVLTVAFGDLDSDGKNEFYVTAAETLTSITEIQNYTDGGEIYTGEGSNDRQVTGIDVTQQFDSNGNPVLIDGVPAVNIYVTSSDSRVGAGGTGGDADIDTNSGTLTRIQQTQTGFEAVDLVRGLSRSEENHATNGLEVIQELDANGNLVSERIILANGGNANAGAPSNNFAGQQETPLSAAILEIDLDMLNSMPVLNDNGRAYIYNVPTLNDPTRPGSNDANDPFGGNDGLNSGKYVDGGPIDIYSAGYRNPYDVEVSEDGRVWTYDNGANNSWGGRPVGEAGDNGSDTIDFAQVANYIATNLNNGDGGKNDEINLPENFSPSNNDNFHEVTRSDDLDGRTLSQGTEGVTTYTDGGLTYVYGGHPNPTRAEGSRAGLLFSPKDGTEDSFLLVSNTDSAGNGGGSDYAEVIAWFADLESDAGLAAGTLTSRVLSVTPGVAYDIWETASGAIAVTTGGAKPAGAIDAQPLGTTGLPSDIGDIVHKTNEVEGNYLEGGRTDGAIDSGKGSINGIAEYTSTILDDGDTHMSGAILAAQLNQGGNLIVLGRDPVTGVMASEKTDTTKPNSIASDKTTIGVDGGPLGLATLGDNFNELGLEQAFQGSVWVAVFNNGGGIQVLQPNNGAVPLAGTEFSDDDDKDLDGVDHVDDPFEFSATNGFALGIGERLTLDFDPTRTTYPDSFNATGLLGAALDGVTPNRNAITPADLSTEPLADGLFDDGGNIIPGGNAPIFQIKEVVAGTFVGTANSARDAMHTGVIVDPDVQRLVATLTAENYAQDGVVPNQFSGLIFGDGTQSNFVRFGIMAVNQNGTPGVELGFEIDDVYTELAEVAIPDLALQSVDQVDLRLSIDIEAGYEVSASYRLAGETDFTDVPVDFSLPPGVLQNVLNGTHTISDGDTTLPSGAAIGFAAETTANAELTDIDYFSLVIDAIGNELVANTAAEVGQPGGSGEDTLIYVGTATGLAPLHPTVENFDGTGSTANFQVTGNSLDNDILLGPGTNTATGAGGDDRFLGTAAQLDGDTITDFSLGDQVVVLGETFNSTDVTFGAGSATLTVDLINDFSITLDGPALDDFQPGDGLDQFTFEVVEGNTIIRLAADVSVSVADLPVSENVGNAAVVFTRSGDTSKAVEITFITAEGTASFDDFGNVLTGSVTIAAGATSATALIPIVNDTLAEGNESFTLSIESATTDNGANDVLISDSTAVITILSNDSLGSNDLDGDGLTNDTAGGFDAGSDPFIIDPDNGLSNLLVAGQTQTLDFEGGGTPISQYNFSGILNAPQDDTQFQEIKSNALISNGKLTVFSVDNGDPFKGSNSQTNSFIKGINVGQVDGFTVETSFDNPFQNVDAVNFMSAGLVLGIDQDTNVRLVWAGGNDSRAVQLVLEYDGTVAGSFDELVPMSAATNAAGNPVNIDNSNVASVKLQLEVDKSTPASIGLAGIVLMYGDEAQTQFLGQIEVDLPNVTPANAPEMSQLLNGTYQIDGQDMGVGYGLVQTSTGSAATYTVAYDYVSITGAGNPPAQADEALGQSYSDFSTDKAAPTDIGTLGLGSNIIVSQTQGDNAGLGRDRDFITFEVADGQVLSQIVLDGYNIPLAAEQGFLALQAGSGITVDLTTGAPDPGKGGLLGGVIYNDGSVGDDLLQEMRDSDVDGSGPVPSLGNTVLTAGTYTLWFNQGADAASVTTVDLITTTDDVTTDMGEAILTLTLDEDDVEISNFGSNSFQVINTGSKDILSIEIDVSSALFPDAVFDPFGQAGDSIDKPLTLNTNGNSGVITSGFTNPNGGNYIGAGGTAGYNAIRLNFIPAGFDPGDFLGFSVDMDPNSIAGTTKSTLDGGALPVNFDVGGISGAELIGSKFTVTFDDGDGTTSTATGYLMGDGSQGGAQAIATQSPSPMPFVDLTVNGFKPGDVGTYDDDGPTVIINGTAGQTARVVVVKGVLQPFNNNFSGSFADQLDQQLADLADDPFPANNALEFETFDIVLTGGNQNITGLFNFDGLNDPGNKYGAVPNPDQLPIGIVASIIDPSQKLPNSNSVPVGPVSNLPIGAVTAPIYLTYDNDGSTGGGTGAFLPNANGDFHFQVESAGETDQPGWNYWSVMDSGSSNYQSDFTGSGYYVSTTTSQSNGGVNPLSYTIAPDVSGTYYVNVRSSRIETSNFTTANNDSFVRILDGTTPLDALPGYKNGQVYQPSYDATGDNWVVAYQIGGTVGDWQNSGNTVFNVGVPIAYELEAGKVYTFQIANRSAGHQLDSVLISYVPNPPDVSQGETTQTLPDDVFDGQPFSDVDDNSVPGLTLIGANKVADQLIGGAGDDFLAGLGGLDFHDGGGGTDTVDFSHTSTGATIDLSAGTATFANGAVEQVLNIENVNATNGSDTIIGTSGNNVINGNGGSDTVVYAGAAGDYVVTQSNGETTVTGIDGIDTLISIESIVFAGVGAGPVYDNVIEGTNANNDLVGGSGNDLLRGFGGIDSHDGGAGNDGVDIKHTGIGATIDLSAETILFANGAVEDIIDIENAIGTQGDNVFIGTSDANFFDGQGGTDTVLYALAASEYTVSGPSTGGFYTVFSEADGTTDTLLSIEVLSFADGDQLL